MSEARKIAAILAADVVGYSRLAATDEDRILARLRTLRSDLLDPTVTVHHGRVVKRLGDGLLVEFRSVVDAVRCAIEVQNNMLERNAGLPPERRIEFRIGIHLGDVVEESDGDLMGSGVNIAARLEGIAQPGAICLSEDAYRQVKARLDFAVSDLGARQLKNIAEPVRVYALEVGKQAKPPKPAALPKKRSRIALLVGGLAASFVVIAASVWHFADLGPPQAIKSDTTVQAVTSNRAPPAVQPPAKQMTFNEAAVRQLAEKQKIPLPPKIVVNAPGSAGSAQLADFLGAWGADQRWNGVGRNVILMIEDIDEAGHATGIYAQGPPNAHTANQSPAMYTSFTSPITVEGFAFAWGSAIFTFKRMPGSLMLGHVQFQTEKGKEDGSITLQHIE